MPGSESYFAERGFKVGKSLRFNDDDSVKLSTTFASAGNTKKWTFSCWVKRGEIDGESHTLFATDRSGTNDFDYIRVQTDDSVYAAVRDDSSNYHFRIITNRKLRDVGAWYHIVVRYDSTAGTPASPENALYINGELQDNLAAGVTPAQDDVTNFNNAVVHHIGNWNASAAYYLDGYLAEVNFVDGYSLPASYFGTTDPAAGNGQWVPTKYSGAYGNNGFYLPFKGYGIAVATGGTITTDGDYKVHSFTSNGTFEVTSITNTDPTLTGAATAEVEYLIIAGGGAGAADGSTTNGNGGGGAGGYIPGSALLTAQTYAVVVGAGGVGALSANAVTGGDSSFNSITADGGGGGGYYVNTPGEGGGSGGGGGANSGAGGGVTTAGFGNAGEAGSSGQGGGGGGAGEAGGTDGTGQGGDGLASSITGSSVTRAGGGGGSRASGGARAGGDGGGGAGGNGGAGGDGSANTGGGGGAGVSGGESGSGGSGIVIIRYKFQ